MHQQQERVIRAVNYAITAAYNKYGYIILMLVYLYNTSSTLFSLKTVEINQ